MIWWPYQMKVIIWLYSNLCKIFPNQPSSMHKKDSWSGLHSLYGLRWNPTHFTGHISFHKMVNSTAVQTRLLALMTTLLCIFLHSWRFRIWWNSIFLFKRNGGSILIMCSCTIYLKTVQTEFHCPSSFLLALINTHVHTQSLIIINTGKDWSLGVLREVPHHSATNGLAFIS